MKTSNSIGSRRICYAAVLLLLSAACTKTAVVYEDTGSEISFSPVSIPEVKGVPGAMEGPGFNGFETFGIFAWHKTTSEAQRWADFYADGTEGPGVKYIDGEPFAKLGNHWAGGYNDLNVSFSRGTGDMVRTVEMNVSVAENTHRPEYWPKTGYLAFAGYSPYYKFETEVRQTADGNNEYVYHTTRTPLANADDGTTVTYNTDDPAHPYLSITGFTQGIFDWEHNNHWATNETCDLMWFDADENWTANLGAGDSRSAVPVTFHHACAWLDFHFRAKDETADRKFVILKATLSNMYWSGDFRSDDGTGKAVWESLGDSERNAGNTTEVVLYYNMGKKESQDYEDQFNYITYENYFEIDDLMIIPQSVDKGSGSVSTLTVYYKQLTSDTPYEPVDNYGEDENPDDHLFDGKPLTEVFTCELPASDGGVWDMGKHYIYDIVFGLDEILVSPAVLDWDDRETSANTEN